VTTAIAHAPIEMTEPPSTTGVDAAADDPTASATVSLGGVSIVVGDEQSDIAIDANRWGQLAADVLGAEGRQGELTLTFVDADEIAALNEEHMGVIGVTDVLSFPLDAELAAHDLAAELGPVLLGDVVICPTVAAGAAPTHAGTFDDELALLVVHGILHVLGHDHAEPDETARMRSAELAHLVVHHWRGPAPAAFRQEHDPA
jgi:probable rRNA maturation factor